MKRQIPPRYARLDRDGFARASWGERDRLVSRWLDDGPLAPSDTHLVRPVPERDLANARAFFGPFVTVVCLFVALLALSISSGQLIGSVTAPAGIILGLVGAWVELHRIGTVSEQLARLDSGIA